MKRVLHVVSTLGVGDGTTSFIMNYYRNINKEKFQFDFLYFRENDNSYINEITSIGGKVQLIPEPSIKNIISYKKTISNVIDSLNYQYEIIHIHVPIFVTLLAPIFRKKYNSKIITHTHSVVYSYNPVKAIRNYLLTMPMKRMSDYFFSCSLESAKFWYGERFIKKANVEIIKNAINCKEFKYQNAIREKQRALLGIDNNIKIIGHVGRFSKEKNQKFLLQILKEILIFDSNVKLLMIGSGKELSKIKEYVKINNLNDNVFLLGQQSNVNELYQAMDIFVFPSVSEGFGTVLIEAQAANLKCIASDSITEEVDICDVKFLSLKDDVKNWSEIIYKELKNSRGNNNMDEIKKKGYCIHEATKVLESLYERMFKG